ncbi:hypothetical protein PC116_g4726 [Phytophthora cactorum]|uniref:Uncharacterized protein n=1 Tax=Phytophthora cactorum TaxID=29920 RepID=A0A8T1DZ45_9STRA|nr:hypothetical protein PC112_g16267 [Phytophthora cactorum]KAG2810298.1 hypothetical protein PC111_g15714 [Phytophthora cactorum]KAG2860603.1 hypothetical protein PC113_g7898 [Phytophthora cactorum]KAG2915460.1 hypothetical protein PC114_g7843 [Phytophthora cactorum]KAG2930201.1 hypothetical protein PC115_g6605 [Phytophthora cactorum]
MKSQSIKKSKCHEALQEAAEDDNIKLKGATMKIKRCKNASLQSFLKVSTKNLTSRFISPFDRVAAA